MGDKVAIWETRSGRIVVWPNVTDYSWEHGLNDTEGSVSFTTTIREVFENTTRPWQYSLAVVSDAGDVLAAGPIYKRDVDMGTGIVQVTAGSFWTLLKKDVWEKSMTPVASPGAVEVHVTDGSVTTYRQTYTSTMDGLAIGIARSQMRDMPGVTDARFPYPSGPHSRTYDGLELKMTSDIIAELFNDVNPATVRWDATYTDGTFEWIARPLSDARRQTWAFSLDTPSGVLSGWKLAEDAGSQVNQCFQVSRVAKGKEDKTPDSSLFARWDVPVSGMWQRLGVIDSSHENVTNRATLLNYAKAVAQSRPYFAFTLEIPKDMVTASGTATAMADAMRPGDWCIITSREGFYGASTFAGRIEKLSGNATTLTVSVERVTRYDGVDTGVAPSDAFMQMPPGDAASRLKQFGDFTRRANNPVLGGA